MKNHTDYHDIELFLQSRKGKAYLRKLTAKLKGRTIVDVDFKNHGHYLAGLLHLNDGSTFAPQTLFPSAHDLREQFGEAIEEEYYRELDKEDKKNKKT